MGQNLSRSGKIRSAALAPDFYLDSYRNGLAGRMTWGILPADEKILIFQLDITGCHGMQRAD